MKPAALRRFYATESSASSAAGKLTLNFVLPHQALLRNTLVQQVNLSSTDGDMGILADHVPTIAELKPGLVEILSGGGAEKSKRYFVSGGFAVMNPNSTLNINAVDAYPLQEIDFEAARKAADEANRKLANPSTSDTDKTTAKIELEIYKAIEDAAKLK